jgi:hypothetical protein
VRYLCPYLLPFVLVTLGFYCCLVATPVVCGQVVPGQLTWVRTADGWELLGSWLHTVPVGPKLNPLLVAAGQILGCLYALLAFSTESGARI